MHTPPGMHHTVKLWYGIDNLGEVGSTAVYPPSWIRVNSVRRFANATLQWQFDLYNKSDSYLSEIQRRRMPELHSLTISSHSSYTGKHGRFQTACNWRRGPVLAPWPSTRPDCNWYISVVFTLPAQLQTLCTQTGPWLHCCYCYSACLQLQTFTLWCPRM